MEALDLLPGGKKCCGEKGGREGSWHGGGACVCACVGECDLHVGWLDKVSKRRQYLYN